ncbi:MAG: DUF2786 domain-containing protein [Polyangiaceae bacterium]
MASGPEFTAALEASLVRELRATWREINDATFRRALRVPTLELVRARSTLGRWVPETRTVEISLPLVIEHPWVVIVEVLKHEMAHQYVSEVLCEASETAHGSAFRNACARLGIDARASGVPEASGAEAEQAAKTENKVVERVARLLALAESPNRHEAEAAMAAAQRLMLKHNLDAVQSATPADYGFLHLGRPTGRVAEHERLVSMILGRHFFVDTIWVPVYRPREGKRASVLEICGARQNLAIAEYAHGFLHGTAERLWSHHKETRGLAFDRERRTYLAGVMSGFADKLARQETANRGEGIVWVEDGDLGDFMHRRHPRVRHIHHAGQRRTGAFADGREAGSAIVLHKPVQAATVSRGRLLSPKS